MDNHFQRVSEIIQATIAKGNIPYIFNLTPHAYSHEDGFINFTQETRVKILGLIKARPSFMLTSREREQYWEDRKAKLIRYAQDHTRCRHHFQQPLKTIPPSPDPMEKAKFYYMIQHNNKYVPRVPKYDELHSLFHQENENDPLYQILCLAEEHFI